MTSAQPEFKSFKKIERYKPNSIEVTITQKLHGTNAQILITEEKEIFCGSRNRWLTPEDDNYGFASFVMANKDEFIEKLGIGRHYGEWCGLGINNGEGLKERTLFLFDWRRFISKELPNRVRLIPFLGYSNNITEKDLVFFMDKLKKFGSFAVEGFMEVEGIVIELMYDKGKCIRYKQVFKEEDTGWTKKQPKQKKVCTGPDVSHLLQPLRLQKLISRDEHYKREFPKSMKDICAAYVKDLEEENQFPLNEEDKDALKKVLGRKIFPFIKEFMFYD